MYVKTTAKQRKALEKQVGVVCKRGGARGLTAHEIEEALATSREKGEVTVLEWEIDEKN